MIDSMRSATCSQVPACAMLSAFTSLVEQPTWPLLSHELLVQVGVPPSAGCEELIILAPQTVCWTGSNLESRQEARHTRHLQQLPCRPLCRHQSRADRHKEVHQKYHCIA